MMEFMASQGNIFLTDPIDNLDTFSAKRFQTFLFLLRQEKVRFFSVSVMGDLPLIPKERRRVDDSDCGELSQANSSRGN